MEGLVDSGADVLITRGGSRIVDASLIGWARRIEHYEMAVYSSAITYAQLLELDQVVVLLLKSCGECEAADARLRTIASEHLHESDALMGVVKDSGSR
jgi:ferritin-like metal-binding protein YciE